MSLQATTITDEAGAPRRFLVQVQDVTHRRHYEENLHYLATHDPLTGLHNRASFANQLDAHADLVRRYGSDGALLLLDLDHFKYINDTLGHAAGDQLIARVATVLRSPPARHRRARPARRRRVRRAAAARDAVQARRAASPTTCSTRCATSGSRCPAPASAR